MPWRTGQGGFVRGTREARPSSGAGDGSEKGFRLSGLLDEILQWCPLGLLGSVLTNQDVGGGFSRSP